MVHCTGPSIDNADSAAALLDSFLVWPYPNAKHVRYVIMFFLTSEISLNILTNS